MSRGLSKPGHVPLVVLSPHGTDEEVASERHERWGALRKVARAHGVSESSPRSQSSVRVQLRQAPVRCARGSAHGTNEPMSTMLEKERAAKDETRNHLLCSELCKAVLGPWSMRDALQASMENRLCRAEAARASDSSARPLVLSKMPSREAGRGVHKGSLHKYRTLRVLRTMLGCKAAVAARAAPGQEKGASLPCSIWDYGA